MGHYVNLERELLETTYAETPGYIPYNSLIEPVKIIEILIDSFKQGVSFMLGGVRDPEPKPNFTRVLKRHKAPSKQTKTLNKEGTKPMMQEPE